MKRVKKLPMQISVERIIFVVERKFPLNSTYKCDVKWQEKHEKSSAKSFLFAKIRYYKNYYTLGTNCLEKDECDECFIFLLNISKNKSG